MRYVRAEIDGRARWGVLEGERVRTLKSAPYLGMEFDGEAHSLISVHLLAPCAPSKIVCLGKNYYEHALEMNEGIPEHPILFIKTPNCVAAPDAEIAAPDFVTRLDYEGELAIVIGKTAKNLTAETALDYVFGYTCLNDITARDVQKGDGQWSRGKCMDGFAPCGPWIAAGIDASDLAISAVLNGIVVQQSRTSQFMTKIPEMLAYITASMTLEAGDVISTGTPAGVGPMRHGDVVEVKIEGIGTLRNTIA